MLQVTLCFELITCEQNTCLSFVFSIYVNEMVTAMLQLGVISENQFSSRYCSFVVVTAIFVPSSYKTTLAIDVPKTSVQRTQQHCYWVCP